MRESINRMFTLLKIDFKQYYLLIIVFSFLPILIFYLPQLSLSKNSKILVYTEKTDETEHDLGDVKYSFIDDKEVAMDLLRRNSIQAIIDENSQEIYMNDQEMPDSSQIKKVIGYLSGKNIDNTSKKQDTYKETLILLCSLLAFFIGLIGGPIIFLGEKYTGMFKILALTPLRYQEYLICNTIISTLMSILSYFIFFMAINVKEVKNISLIVIVVLVSILISVLAGVVSMIFSTLEKTLMVITPLLIGLTFLELQFWLGNLKGYLPIQEGFRSAINETRINLWTICIYIALIILLSFVFIVMYKKDIKRN